MNSPTSDDAKSPLLGPAQHRKSFSNLYSATAATATNVGWQQSIRFQVVVWHIGQIDMRQGRVPVTFRVTLFWNDSPHSEENDDDDDLMSMSSRSSSVWQMQGRQQAIQKEIKDIPIRTVPVPALSLLNVVTFDTIGAPQVELLRDDTRLMRWTCMYRATLIQTNWRVDNFPHDDHDICLKLAILADRRPGQQWDRQIWNLALATGEDSRGSTRIPYGLLVDEVRIPEFIYNKDDGLRFDFVALKHGPGSSNGEGFERCLEVKLRVLRDSSYFDKNIMPILSLLNFVAISILCLKPEDFFQRALLTLNIGFCEFGLRMRTDSHLPNVSYQIKMQRILNEYFFGLMFLVLEGCLVYDMQRRGWTIMVWVDAAAAFLKFFHNVSTLYFYYGDASLAKRKILNGSKKEMLC